MVFSISKFDFIIIFGNVCRVCIKLNNKMVCNNVKLIYNEQTIKNWLAN